MFGACTVSQCSLSFGVVDAGLGLEHGGDFEEAAARAREWIVQRVGGKRQGPVDDDVLSSRPADVRHGLLLECVAWFGAVGGFFSGKGFVRPDLRDAVPDLRP